MKLHWQVLIGLVAGILLGFLMQIGLEGAAYSGLELGRATPGEPGVPITSIRGPAADARGLAGGQRIRTVVRARGEEREERFPIEEAADFEEVVAQSSNGDVLWIERVDREPVLLTLGLDPRSPRGAAVKWVDLVADVFMALLQMLIVPIILTSIITGVAGVGALGDLGRLGGKTFGYYVVTSLLAILVGQALVNLISPGSGAKLGLSPLDPEALRPEGGFGDVLERMVPENVFEALGDNGSMLQVIFFALLFGLFVTRAPHPHRERMTEFFESAFAVMLQVARGILKLLPIGVLALMARVVAKTGFGAFESLLVFMGTVTLALAIHACVTLPLLLRFVGGVSPRKWFRAMSPALMTAFSSSSSSMTLPVTMETAEERGKVSNRVSSFTLPLGATINMDGTALYECTGVIFLAQFYASTGEFALTLGDQAMVVLMALMASVGAAGIPSAGLVMMLTILSSLGLPVEGAALLLAVDRPLDMMRTVVNVWSDSCAAAVIARTEGEEGPLLAGEP